MSVATLIPELLRVGQMLAENGGEPEVLADRPDGVVVKVAEVVVKAHPTGTDEEALCDRLRAASSAMLRGVFLAPLSMPDGTLYTRVGERLVTAWPAGTAVDPQDPDAAPWEAAAHALARLHTTDVTAVFPAGAPPAGGPRRVARAMERLRRIDHPQAKVVRAAYRSLPAWATGAAVAPPPSRLRGLTHGDWHLGQVVALAGSWLLIDVDDLGVGDPSWDLARPAAWYAAGLLPPEVWRRFLDAYRAAGGPALPAEGDPWSVLDIPARALVTQSAALALVTAEREGRGLDEVDTALVTACARITSMADVS